MSERAEIPEYVDLEKMEYAQSIKRAGILFCRECGATRPRHGFYPLLSGAFLEGEHDLATVSLLVCNCCHATKECPCFYCAEEERAGVPIDVRRDPVLSSELGKGGK